MAKKPKNARLVNGILLFDKPSGVSSHSAMIQVRDLFRAKKAGHAGNLDLLASGMLPLCLGETTKVSRFILESDKEYIAVARLGQNTATGDCESDIILERDVPEITRVDLLGKLKSFEGLQEQTPPMHSAVKHAGKPLYKLARMGVEVERKIRQINIRSIELISIDLPTIKLKIRCSKGTFIRTLVEDIGEAFTCGAHLANLHRSVVSPFEDARMWALDEILEKHAAEGPEGLDEMLLPSDYALRHYEIIQFDKDQSDFFVAGGFLSPNPERNIVSGQIVRIYNSRQNFLGLAQLNENNELRAKRVFNIS